MGLSISSLTTRIKHQNTILLAAQLAHLVLSNLKTLSFRRTLPILKLKFYTTLGNDVVLPLPTREPDFSFLERCDWVKRDFLGYPATVHSIRLWLYAISDPIIFPSSGARGRRGVASGWLYPGLESIQAWFYDWVDTPIMQ